MAMALQTRSRSRAWRTTSVHCTCSLLMSTDLDNPLLGHQNTLYRLISSSPTNSVLLSAYTPCGLPVPGKYARARPQGQNSVMVGIKITYRRCGE